MSMRTFVFTTFFLLILGTYVPSASAFASIDQDAGGTDIDNSTQTPAPTTIAPQTQTPPASTGNTDSTITLINPLKGVDCSNGNGNCLVAFLTNILKFVIQIGTIVVVLMVVFVGYKFVAARGNDAKLIEARQMLLWTVVGALILLGAQAIALTIQATVQAISVS